MYQFIIFLKGILFPKELFAQVALLYYFESHVVGTYYKRSF